MRRLLIRLLLLALCFHTVVGRPAHEASHSVQAVVQALEGAAQRSAALEASGEIVERGEAGPGGQGVGGADGLCAWCLAFAQVAAITGGAGPPLPAVATAGPPAPAASASGFLPGLDRWRFSARDPPAAASRG